MLTLRRAFVSSGSPVLCVKAKTFHVCLSLLLGVLLPIAVYAGGNDFVASDWRIDTINSTGYDFADIEELIYPTSLSSRYDAFTTAWPSVYLDNASSSMFPKLFTQVGVQTKNGQLYWFVYSEAGVGCLRGVTIDAYGCNGVSGDLVSQYQWTRFELVTYGNNYWIARVYDQNSVGHDVAQIGVTNPRVHGSTVYDVQFTTEEGYDVNPDPYLVMTYYHYHPQYNISGVGFVDWPGSGGGNNDFLFTAPSGICPTIYGAQVPYAGDQRFWATGSGLQQCSYTWP